MAKELLVCLPTLAFGGHERMVVRIAAALAAGGTRITVVCRPLPQLLEELSKVPELKVRLGYGSSFGQSGVIATMRALLSSPRHIPVLFAPGHMLAHRLHILAAGLLRRQVLAYVPTSEDTGSPWRMPRKWLADRLAAGVVSRWLTITGPLATSLRRHRHVRAPVDVIPNIAPDPGSLSRSSELEATSRMRVLFLGRYDPYGKGLDWLAEALRDTKAQWVGRMRFAFHGDGAGRPLLEALARDCGPRNVAVHGWSDSYSALAAADLMVLPSRFEGFPLVFIEAAKAGVPVLASRFEGAAELLGEGAWLEVGDGPGLLGALQRLCDAPLRRRVADVQRATVLAHADEGKFVAAVATLQTRL